MRKNSVSQSFVRKSAAGRPHKHVSAKLILSALVTVIVTTFGAPSAHAQNCQVMGQNIRCPSCAALAADGGVSDILNGPPATDINKILRIDNLVQGDQVTFNLTTLAGNPDTEIQLIAPGTQNQCLVGSSTIACNPPTGAGFVNGSRSETYTVPAGGVGDQGFSVMLGQFSPAGKRIRVDCNCTPASPARTINFQKKTLGSTGQFDFDVTSQPPASSVNPNPFDITTGNQTSFFPPNPGLPVSGFITGTYNIKETFPGPGWTLTDLQCNKGVTFDITDNGANKAFATATITVDNASIPSGDTVCRFTNSFTPPGEVTICKKTIGDTGRFRFNVNSGQHEFVLDTRDDNPICEEPLPLPVGTNVVTETFPSGEGWTLRNVRCDGTGVTPQNIRPQAGRAELVVASSRASATCTFINERDTGSITIKKRTQGGFGEFEFDTSGAPLPSEFSLTTSEGNNPDERTFENLPLGQTYEFEEDVPDGWDLTDIDCTAGGTQINNTARIMLSDRNKNVTCTFKDFKENDEPMEEETKRFIKRRVDNLLTHGPDRARMLRRLQEQAPPSLKDTPIKFSGNQSSSGSLSGSSIGSISSGGAMSLGGSLSRSSFGPTSSGGMMSLGSTLAHNGDTTIPDDGVPWMREAFPSSMPENAFGTATGPTSAAGSLFSALASQLMPLAGGQASFKFGTSLSEIRAKAAEAEARAQQKKLEDAGLSFTGQPYTNPYIGLRPGLDIWVEGHIVRYNDDIGGIDRDGDFGILYVGADYVLAPGILIGALVQVDDTDEDINGPIRTGEIEGTGWMVGPYFGARLLNHLFFDARAAWGQSDNDIWIDDVAGFRRGSFDTDRWLATATLTGVHYHGAWRFSPEIGLKYGHESYDTYRNSLGQTVRGADADIGRLTGGAEVAYRMQTWNGTIIEPMVGISGIWNFDSDDLVIGGVLQDSDDNRAKVEGGVLVRAPSGWGIRAAGTYDGIGGDDDFESYGGSLWVNIPLN